MTQDDVTLTDGPERWRGLAQELGGAIGRSKRPVSFLLGAGASRSSGGPGTDEVTSALEAATKYRFEGVELMRAIHLLEEEEKQEILQPLFNGIQPGPGYTALAALAAYRKVVVLNLNWDDALAQAGRRTGVLRSSFDILSDPSERPDLADGEVGLHDIHLHGILGSECRFGTLETLPLTPEQESFLVQSAFGHVLVCLGASLNDENDLPNLFRQHQLERDLSRPPSHWYFVRGQDREEGEDRLRKELTRGSALTYVKSPAMDFDVVATMIVDAALGSINAGS